jgi:hypothetical protein
VRKEEERIMSDKNVLVAVYDTHAEADHAVKELQRAGFEMVKLSIVGKEYHSEQNIIGCYNASDRMKSWGERGAFWGGLWGLLSVAAFFALSGAA